jgi:hypothetical protein
VYSTLAAFTNQDTIKNKASKDKDAPGTTVMDDTTPTTAEQTRRYEVFLSGGGDAPSRSDQI